MANLILIYHDCPINDNLLLLLFLWNLIVYYLLDMHLLLILWWYRVESWIHPLLPSNTSSQIFQIQARFKFQLLLENFCLILEFSFLFSRWFHQQSCAVNRFQKFLWKLSFFLDNKYHWEIFSSFHFYLHLFYILVIQKYY